MTDSMKFGLRFLLLATITSLFGFTIKDTLMHFQNNTAERQLEVAIEQDSPAGVDAAIAAGANPDAVGLHGVTPLLAAVGEGKHQALAALLKHRAHFERRDADGNNAVSLAAESYKMDPRPLQMLLNAGADPNTVRANGDPIIVRFLNDRDFDAARYLHSAGANLNVRNKSERPLVISYGISEDWDVLYFLISLGAECAYPNEPMSWADIFSTPGATPPDSPLWPYKVKVWHLLKTNKQAVPPRIEDLVSPEYWEYLAKKGLPRTPLE